MKKECKNHGLTEFSSGPRPRCKKCAVESVTKKRINTKLKAIEYKGGKCEICGYNKSAKALDFHHVNPEEKSFGISSGNTISWERTKVELDKCILICANCHRELH